MRVCSTGRNAQLAALSTPFSFLFPASACDLGCRVGLSPLCRLHHPPPTVQREESASVMSPIVSSIVLSCRGKRAPGRTTASGCRGHPPRRRSACLSPTRERWECQTARRCRSGWCRRRSSSRRVPWVPSLCTLCALSARPVRGVASCASAHGPMGRRTAQVDSVGVCLQCCAECARRMTQRKSCATAVWCQAKKWHPDTLPHDSPQRTLYEAKFKTINTSYRELLSHCKLGG